MFSHFLRKLRPVADPRTTPHRRDGRIWHALPAAVPLLDEFAVRPDDQLVKKNLQRTIHRLVRAGGVYFVKVCRANTPRAWAREILRPPKARLEFENALHLRDQGVGCTEPLAWAEVDSLWPGASVIVTREEAEAVSLEEMLVGHDNVGHVSNVPSVDTRHDGIVPHEGSASVGHVSNVPLVTSGHDGIVPHEGSASVGHVSNVPLVTSRHDGIVPQDLSPAMRRRVAVELGHFFARMHAAGVIHPDPHPGNFLVQPSALRFVLLDVHAVRFDATPPLIRDNLIAFNRWFQVRASRTDRARFWQAYCESSRDLEQQGEARELESATADSNRRFWADRTPRYFGSNRQFRKVKAPGLRGMAVRDLPDAVVKAWLADPDAVFTRPGVTLLKDSPSSTVAEVQVGTRAVIFKRFRLKSPWLAVKNALRPSAARRSWQFGHNLLDRHLPTARPLFFAHRYRLGLPCEGYVAFEKVPDVTPLSADGKSFAELRDLADRLGRLLRTMHERHVSHRDLKAANILLSGGEPVLIDLVGVVTGPLSDAERTQNLARLNASFLQTPHVSRPLRLRLLRTYLAGRGDWKSWWTCIAAATHAKRLKNLQSGRPLA